MLINEASASASEIIAGCIQDQDRGLIIGTPTYGKGLVQEQFELSNGGILRMTVSKYYTPSGRSIQKAYDSTSVVDTSIIFKTSSADLYMQEVESYLISWSRTTSTGNILS